MQHEKGHELKQQRLSYRSYTIQPWKICGVFFCFVLEYWGHYAQMIMDMSLNSIHHSYSPPLLRAMFMSAPQYAVITRIYFHRRGAQVGHCTYQRRLSPGLGRGGGGSVSFIKSFSQQPHFLSVWQMKACSQKNCMWRLLSSWFVYRNVYGPLWDRWCIFCLALWQERNSEWNLSSLICVKIATTHRVKKNKQTSVQWTFSLLTGSYHPL